MSLLEVNNLSHTYGDHPLFKDAEFTLNKGEHIGVVGSNGVGKSTLIKICTEQVIPDAGQITWQPQIKTGYLDQYAQIHAKQTMQTFLESAFADLYSLEEKMNRSYQQAAGGNMEAFEAAAQIQEELERRGFYIIQTRIDQVVTGLGLDAIGLDRPIGQMSGGQRTKTILAKLLLEKPDVLLLDEPTNFLDKEHIAWLAQYLSSLDNAFMVVSHDYDFLEKVADYIADIDSTGIKKYKGTYSEFLKKKELLRKDYIRQYTAQQKEIEKTEEFIRKNRAGRKAKMARGRQKQLERLDRMEAPEVKEIKPVFPFRCLPMPAAEALVVKQLAVGYDFAVLSGLDFIIRGGEKIVISGFNGIGKSTLLKTLVGQIPAIKGKFSFTEQAVIGYFEQAFTWQDNARNPIETLMEAYPSLTDKEARARLARCGISSKHAMQPVGTLSGGEQAKVKMCVLTCRPVNFLILDEPTNHLDRLAKEALKEALSRYPGTVLMVSHEEAFYRDWAHRIIHIAKITG